jgi:Outer membrane protein beta-barrel domain
MNKQTFLAGLLMLGAITTATAHERDHEGRRSYLGAGFAELSVDDEDFGYEADDNGFKLIAGVEFNKYLAAELGYLGGATLVDPGLFDVEEVDLRAVTGSIVGRFPLTSTISMFGKVGVARYEMDFRWLIDEEIVDADRFRDDELIYGFGLSAHLGDRFEVRGEYEAIENAFDVISINGVLKFR